MADAAIAADLHHALDVQRNIAAQIAFDLQIVLDVFTDLVDILLGQVLHAGVRVDAGSGENLLRGFHADAEDVRQSDFDPLLTRQVNARNTCHYLPPISNYGNVFCWISFMKSRMVRLLIVTIRGLALLLLVLGILADDHDAALALDDLALFADRLDRRSYLHMSVPPRICFLNPCCAR